MSTYELPIPAFFDPARVAQVYRVPYQERAEQAAAWARQHGITPAASDAPRIGLVIIDAQNTFCLPEFELFVGGRTGRGAVDDNARLCAFIYRNLGLLSNITLTMDTHSAQQIFHPAFWVGAHGEHPAPHSTISVLDVEQGVWRVNPALAKAAGRTLPELDRYARHYVRELEGAGKFQLTIWPYHAMLGGIGHAVVSAIEEAAFFHGIARATQPDIHLKGSHLLTENYSAVRPEVLAGPDGESVAAGNAGFVSQLLGLDAMIIAGQAKSHCVAWTVADLLHELQARDPKLANRVYLLEDCTSPVVVPGRVDFTDEADRAFARFAGAGMHRVLSSTPLADWPGLNLGR